MIAIPYIAAGSFVAGLALGGWVGADWIGGEKYSDGFAAGVASQQKVSDREFAILRADARAESEQIQRERAEDARKQEQARQVEREAARVEYVSSEARNAAAVDRLYQRLRAAEAAAARSANRRADGGSGVPAAAGSTARTDGPSFSRWLFHPAGGEAAVRLGKDADWINRQFAICWREFPRNKTT
ncbi:MAG: hypothetical protein H0T60_15770 [Acidobacteria bacterium]|nr:hypothetical protein [Acidobacteriota bacterium]